jgi:hypothetical protein
VAQAEVKLTEVKAIKRCAEPEEAGRLSVGFTSAARHLEYAILGRCKHRPKSLMR